MASFNKDTYDPRSESSNGVEQEGFLVLSLTTGKDVEGGRPSCLCGCGGTPSGKKARFIPGHDARYKGMLNRAHIAGVKVVIVEDGTAKEPVTAMSLAKAQGWESNVKAAKDTYDKAAKAREERAAKAEADKAAKAEAKAKAEQEKEAQADPNVEVSAA